MCNVAYCVWSPRCQFSTFEQCQEWLKRLNTVVRPPSRLEDLFSFAFHAWCMNVYAGEKEQHGELCRPGALPPLTCPHITPAEPALLSSPLIGHLCSVCRRTRDLLVQERGGADGLWHSKRLEDIRHQQQVQVIAAFIQDTPGCVDFRHSQLEERSVLCFHWCTAQVSVCVRQWVVVLLYSTRAAPWADKSPAQD